MSTSWLHQIRISCFQSSCSLVLIKCHWERTHYCKSTLSVSAGSSPFLLRCFTTEITSTVGHKVMVQVKTNPATNLPVEYLQVDQYHSLTADATASMLGAGTKVGAQYWSCVGRARDLSLRAVTSALIPLNRL